MESGDDGHFGPQLAGKFDFTLFFEHSILSIPISGLFIVASFIKLWWFPLERTAVPVTRNWLLSLKTVRQSNKSICKLGFLANTTL